MSASNNNINLNSSSKRPIFSLRSSSTVDFDQEANYDDDTNNNKDQSSERLVPIANVGRIMKQILPNNAKISKEAKETMQECVSEFIGFVTSEASEKCRKERRKTVNGDDICWAMGALGFDDYAGPLKRYLNRFRDIEGNSSSNNNNQNNTRVGVTNGDEEEIMLQENFLLYTSNEQSKELG